MFLLDENIPKEQRITLIRYHLPMKHPNFNAYKKRMGWVVEVQKTRLKGIRVGKTDEFKFTW